MIYILNLKTSDQRQFYFVGSLSFNNKTYTIVDLRLLDSQQLSNISRSINSGDLIDQNYNKTQLIDIFNKFNSGNITASSSEFKLIDSWDASLNEPKLTDTPSIDPNSFYIVSVAGSTKLSNITSWAIGDRAIYNGTKWIKTPNQGSTVALSNITGLGDILDSKVNTEAFTSSVSDINSKLDSIKKLLDSKEDPVNRGISNGYAATDSGNLIKIEHSRSFESINGLIGPGKDFKISAGSNVAIDPVTGGIIINAIIPEYKDTRKVILEGDSRLSDARETTGKALGDLTGVFPELYVRLGTITDDKIGNRTFMNKSYSLSAILKLLSEELIPNIQLDIANINSHVASTKNPHCVTATQIGLGNLLNEIQLTQTGNLSDLANIDSARSNLNVFSKDETNFLISDLYTHVGDIKNKLNSHLDLPLVTAKNIGLGNLTNNAQLIRGPKDFSSFPNKGNINSGDILLIEDAISGEKRSGLFSNIDHSILANSGKYQHPQIDSHIDNFANPHNVTAAHVGLDQVLNVPQLNKNNNLSDLSDISKAKANLGIGGLASQDPNNVNITGGNIVTNKLTASEVTIKGGDLINVNVKGFAGVFDQISVKNEIGTNFCFKVNGTKVVGNRQLGWGTPKAPATKGPLEDYTGTAQVDPKVQLLDSKVVYLTQVLAALINDLTAHGLIG